MSKGKFDGKLVKEILLGIASIGAVASLTVLLAAAPGFGVVAKVFIDWYEKQNKYRRHRIRKTFQSLRRSRLIEEKEFPDGTTRIVLSENGQKKILKYKFDDFQMRDFRKWDGKWQFIIFDLPKKFIREREIWRYKLKTLGFYLLQKVFGFIHTLVETK